MDFEKSFHTYRKEITKGLLSINSEKVGLGLIV